MKKTLDSNIFIFATISEQCAKEVDDTYIQNKFNIIIKSVSYESRSKLLDLFTKVLVFNNEIRKTKHIEKLINSSYYNNFKEKFPQIYDALRSHIIKNKINTKKKIDEFSLNLLDILNDIRYLINLVSEQKRQYPLTEDDFNKIKNLKIFIDTFDSLKTIIKNNDNDRTHLALCKCYINNIKDELKFITIDKDDFLKNKSEIEALIKSLIIETLPNLNIESISL